MFSKLFYDAGGDAYTLLFTRFLIAGPALALLALARRDPWPPRRIALVAASLGVLQLGVAFALFEGYARAPVALVTLLYFVYPLLTAVGAVLIFGEALGPWRAAALAVALAGVTLTIGVPESATWLGIVLGLVAGTCVACLILSGRYLIVARAISPIVLCALMFTSPVIALTLAIPARAPDFDLSTDAWGWLLCAALVSAVIPVGFFYTGVKRIGAMAAGLLSTADPLVSVLLAYAVLGEALEARELLGGALIIAAAVLLSLENARGRTAPGNPDV